MTHKSSEFTVDIYKDPAPSMFEQTPIGLIIRGHPTFEEWYDEGIELWKKHNELQWCIGDWLAKGEILYNETYAQAVDITHYAVKTLQNKVFVSRAIEFSRRRKELSWSHHDAVAGITSHAAQDALLDKAVKFKWGRDELREAVALYRHNQERLKRGENLDDPEPVLLPACGNDPKPLATVTVAVKALRGIPELNEQLQALDDAELVRLDVWKG